MQLRKKRHESEDCEQEYQEAWLRYEERQRRTKTIIRNHIVEYERNRINEFVLKGRESLPMRGQEGKLSESGWAECRRSVCN